MVRKNEMDGTVEAHRLARTKYYSHIALVHSLVNLYSAVFASCKNDLTDHFELFLLNDPTSPPMPFRTPTHLVVCLQV